MKKASENSKKTTIVRSELMYDAKWLSGGFMCEANFVASYCQVYHYTAIYIKYFIKEVLKTGLEGCKMQLCRFRVLWKLMLETGFIGDSLLEVKKDYWMVNQYNQNITIGL